ncbi:UNVERIFIED_CONTAM: hypothetical protein GTU68_044058 [Idotea baltica]|nr:hypothetical protein [Idotea baltica]
MRERDAMRADRGQIRLHALVFR